MFWGSEVQYRHHLQPIADALGFQVSIRPLPGVSVVASRKDAKRCETAIVVEHGAGQRYQHDAGGSDYAHPNVIGFLAPSQRVADQCAVIYPKAERIVVGSPRVEYLTSLPRNPVEVTSAWHWNSNVAPEARSAWPWYQRSLTEITLGHAHPRMRNRVRSTYRRARIPYEEDWAEAVRRTRVLVCDNSSVMWEACALNIPVVVCNAPWYRRSVDWGLRFWEFSDVGVNVDHPSELADALTENHDTFKVRRSEAAEYVYGRIEGSTDRAVEAILGIIEQSDA